MRTPPRVHARVILESEGVFKLWKIQEFNLSAQNSHMFFSILLACCWCPHESRLLVGPACEAWIGDSYLDLYEHRGLPG